MCSLKYMYVKKINTKNVYFVLIGLLLFYYCLQFVQESVFSDVQSLVAKNVHCNFLPKCFGHNRKMLGEMKQRMHFENFAN